MECIIKLVVKHKFNISATSKDKLLPIEVNRIVENLPVIDSVFEQSSLCNLIRLGQVKRDLDQRNHVVLNTEFLDEFQTALPRKSISGNVIFTCINTCEDTADVSSRDLWFKCLDNFVVPLLASNQIGPSISLSEDYLCVIETPIRARDERDQESRLKLMTGYCPTICTGKISLLLSFLGLGFFVELIFDLLIAIDIDLGHVIIKRPCGMGKCCVGIAGQNRVNIGIIFAE